MLQTYLLPLKLTSTNVSRQSTVVNVKKIITVIIIKIWAA